MAQSYITKATFSLEEAIKGYNPETRTLTLGGWSKTFKKGKNRVITHLTKSPQCPCCERKTTHLALQKHLHQKGEVWHVNAWCEEGLMTVDHIVPKAHGGSNRLENLRVMCQECNREKADELPK